MKVDEFITIYKLITEQSFYTLPFCILSIVGFLYFLSGLFSKELLFYNKRNIIIYASLFFISLVVLILKRDYDESVRKDALRIKQYYILYCGDYETIEVKTIENSVENISESKIDEIVNKFPNDFTYAQKGKCSEKLLVLTDTSVMNPLKKHLENLVYLKLKSTLDTKNFISFDTLREMDRRLTDKIIETVSSQHPDEFIVQRDINKPKTLSWVIIKRIK